MAVCGFALQTWFAGHILLVNRKIMGVIEVKTERNTLSGEADQSALLLTDPPPNMLHVQLSLSSASESTGVETYAPDACKPFRAASPPSTVLDDVAGSVDSQVWPSAAEEP